MAKKKIEKKEENKNEILEYVNKTYGKGKIFMLPEKETEYNPKDFISSGSLCLNYIMTGDYRCGFPRKKPVEIFGNESVCKSTLALTVAKQASQDKLQTLYCDAERGLNEFYAKKLGIDPKYFYYFLSDFGEESFEISEDLLNKFNFDLFVYDSIGGMRTRSVVEGDYDKQNMGDHAKLVGKAIIKLGKFFYSKNIAPIIINQLGKKIGELFGNPNDTKGGQTLKFQLWIRLEVSAPRGDKIEEQVKQKGSLDDLVLDKDQEEEIEEVEVDKKSKGKKGKKKKVAKITEETGTIINIKTIKNKMFVPRKKCRLKLIYGKGFDKGFDLIEYLHMQGIAKKVGESKIIYKKKSMLNSSFIKKLKDENFKKEIFDKIEEHRKSIHTVLEDENFLD